MLMTTYNGAATVGDSIAGVLAQTMTDFELVVVDDASTDATPDILASIDDRRVRVIRAERNLGVTGARNLGFAACRGEYIAAHDHDDISQPERLARQVALLDVTPEVVLAATEVELETDGRRGRSGHVERGDALSLRWLLLVDNPLTWSSVMLRAAAVRQLGQFVRGEFELADDFDLYHRLSRVGDIMRLPAPLVVYRWHGTNTARAGRERLMANAAKVLAGAYRPWLADDADDAAGLVVRHLSHRQPVVDVDTLDRLGKYLERLLDGFVAAHAVDRDDRELVTALAGEGWWKTVRAAVRAGHPGLIGGFRARAGLAAGFRPRAADRTVSVAVGAARGLRSITA
ncbi:MAG TPA: glycosyltransferase [Acetobacteraceae bacterium]|nr:glycosyltransferase [Acetobacteraceae bacterium]